MEKTESVELFKTRSSLRETSSQTEVQAAHKSVTQPHKCPFNGAAFHSEKRPEHNFKQQFCGLLFLHPASGGSYKLEGVHTTSHTNSPERRTCTAVSEL